MNIVVIGGTTAIGSTLVSALQARGHAARLAGPASGVDTFSGAGLRQALDGATVVVDVSEAPCLADGAAMAFFTTSTSNLLHYEVEAGVQHHVALSVVGIERLLEASYFRARCAQERLIAGSTVAYSIVRAAQSFESLRSFADAATDGVIVRVPPTLVQPVAAEDVAQLLATVAVGPPLNSTIELGGPEPFYLSALVQRVLGFDHDPRRVMVDPHAPYFGAQLHGPSLLAADDAELGTLRFDDWLHQHQQPRSRARASARGTAEASADTMNRRASLKPNEFLISDLAPGSVLRVGQAAVFSVAGGYCATQATCTHRAGLLSEGAVDDVTVTCALHGAQFNVWTGAVLRGPAAAPLETYRVIVEGEVGRVEDR